jgi:hypothetical protein
MCWHPATLPGSCCGTCGTAALPTPSSPSRPVTLKLPPRPVVRRGAGRREVAASGAVCGVVAPPPPSSPSPPPRSLEQGMRQGDSACSGGVQSRVSRTAGGTYLPTAPRNKRRGPGAADRRRCCCPRPQVAEWWSPSSSRPAPRPPPLIPLPPLLPAPCQATEWTLSHRCLCTRS